jgi:voltage-gated potassium channel
VTAAAQYQKKSLRWRLYVLLEPRAWKHDGLSPLNRLVSIVILAAVVLVIFETEEPIYLAYRDWFHNAEIVISVFFTIEYLTRLWVAGEDPRYRGFVGRLRFVTTPTAIIDLLALSPMFLGLLGSEAFLARLFRLVRILRLAKLGRYSRAFSAIMEALNARRYELWMSAAIAVMLMLVSSTLLYLVEGGGQPESFGSIPRAMWWSIATLTTVGYGDVFPVTLAGRVLAGMTALTGIGLIAMPTGILAAAFSDALQKQRAEAAAESEFRAEAAADIAISAAIVAEAAAQETRDRD